MQQVAALGAPARVGGRCASCAAASRAATCRRPASTCVQAAADDSGAVIEDAPTTVEQQATPAALAAVAAAGTATWACAPPPPPILTGAEATFLLRARGTAATAAVSLDFGKSESAASLGADGVTLTGAAGWLVPWAALEGIADSVNGAFALEAEDGAAGGATRARLVKVQAFSAATQRPVSLMPSGWRTPPTALIAGFSMHRFGKGVDPRMDTARKLSAVAPLRPGARVLDICTGLGYTAVAAAERGAVVTTIELDEAMQAMCAANAWSRSAAPVRQILGDAAEVVAALPSRAFDRIIHDPPTLAIGGALYSAAFYEQLARLTAAQGVLYHYTGDPSSAGTARTVRGVVRRLQEAGFECVAVDEYGHGVIAGHAPLRPNRPPPAERRGGAQRGGGGGGRAPRPSDEGRKPRRGARVLSQSEALALAAGEEEEE